MFGYCEPLFGGRKLKDTNTFFIFLLLSCYSWVGNSAILSTSVLFFLNIKYVLCSSIGNFL